MVTFQNIAAELLNATEKVNVNFIFYKYLFESFQILNRHGGPRIMDPFGTCW